MRPIVARAHRCQLCKQAQRRAGECGERTPHRRLTPCRSDAALACLSWLVVFLSLHSNHNKLLLFFGGACTVAKELLDARNSAPHERLGRSYHSGLACRNLTHNVYLTAVVWGVDDSTSWQRFEDDKRRC
eukprot:5758294-Prymnesium_polylepis.1